ncbi:MAG: hypothetical protein Kow0075_09640 [Salibacteraceae bacterium]
MRVSVLFLGLFVWAGALCAQSFWRPGRANDLTRPLSAPVDSSHIGIDYIDPVKSLDKLGHTEPSGLIAYPIMSAYLRSGGKPTPAYEAIGGVHAEGWISNKWFFDANLYAGLLRESDYMQSIIDSVGAIPGLGNPVRKGVSGDYTVRQLQFTLGWRPGKHFLLTAGRGRHFIGAGYRTMFLSDFSAPYYFGRLDVSAWKLNYAMIYSKLHTGFSGVGAVNSLQGKYATMHYLSMELFPWLEIGAFEAVVWEQEDSVQKRGFDAQYLNPVIFYRPIEYGLGSSDNSLLGFTSIVKTSIGLLFYGQITIDELIVMKALAPVWARIYPDSAIQTGWFENKHAFQLGMKWRGKNRLNKWSALAEINAVRPYTFAHTNINQNYTHMGQPLAHPLGANFIEWVAGVHFAPTDRVSLRILSTLSRKGYSNHLRNMGENPNRTTIEISGQGPLAGHFIGQGRRVDVGNITLETGYVIVQKWQMMATVAVQHRLVRTHQGSSATTYAWVGVSTAFLSRERSL